MSSIQSVAILPSIQFRWLHPGFRVKSHEKLGLTAVWSGTHAVANGSTLLFLLCLVVYIVEVSELDTQDALLLGIAMSEIHLQQPP